MSCPFNKKESNSFKEISKISTIGFAILENIIHNVDFDLLNLLKNICQNNKSLLLSSTSTIKYF